MRAEQKNLLMFVNRNRQFQVPIYQRRYDWGKEECEQLWNDVLGAGADKSTLSYFLGSIVYINEDKVHNSAPTERCHLIDGQQRLATVSLLLAALGEAIEAESVQIGINKTNLQNLYLFNANVPDNNYRHKYLLTETDKETLNLILEGRRRPANPSKHLLENYDFFKKKLQPQNLKAVYEGIHKLEIVDVLLERNRGDNPHLIFESINSTGTQLTHADRIRNYIFMGQSDFEFQNRLYEDHWRLIEQRFGQDYAEPLCQFIKDYIMLKTQEDVTGDDVYKTFKEEVSNKDEGALEESIKEIDRYSEYYVRFVPLKEDCRIKETDPELCERFESFNALQVTTVFPLLLSLYEDYKKKRLQKTEFIEVLRLIENYIVRRTICGGTGTKHMREVFLKLISDIDKSDHIESLKKAFEKQTGLARYYSDAEFKERFCNVNVYSKRGCHYYLCRLEGYEHPKEQILLEDCTKERVMPKTITEEWEDELGENGREVHENYLNTIGNLTLTANNSKLSNKSFKEKKEILRDSPLSLNRDIVQIVRWDKTTIIKRANKLSEKALKIWPDHGVSRGMQHEQKEGRTEADYPHLTGGMMELYQQLKNRIQKLDDSVSQSFPQRYIAFKLNNNNFVIIEPQAKGLRLSLKISYSELFDPARLAKDDSYKKNGMSLGSQVFLSSTDDISNVMDLVRQAFNR